MAIDVEGFKQGQKAIWSSGDFPDVAQTIQPASDLLIERIGIEPGHAVLDVAAGTGNLSIPAAQRGASVTGLDLTPELLEVARERATTAGVEVDFVEGDAEGLPFADDSFDRVTSVFGVIFAPRHQQAASELVRTCRPGGRIAFTAWTPNGINGQMFKVMGGFMPAPPPEMKSPVMWGDESYAASLFDDRSVELEFERQAVVFTAESTDAWMSYHERVLGPIVMAKSALEPQGKWDDLRAELVAMYEAANEATDGTMRCEAEYLLATGTVTG